MEVFVLHIISFTVFVGLGVIFNFIRKKVRKENLSAWRIAEEVFGTIWIALLVAGGLYYFTVFPPFVIYGIASICGFFHSYIIDKIGKGLLEFISEQLKKRISGVIGGNKYDKKHNN